MDFTNYLANKLINLTVRNIGYTAPAKVYLALYITNPTKDSTGTEVSGPSYSRPTLIMGEPVDGVSNNTSQITYAVATSDWGYVGWVGVMDSKEEGNLLYFTELDNPKTVLTGDQLRVQANKIKLTLT